MSRCYKPKGCGFDPGGRYCETHGPAARKTKKGPNEAYTGPTKAEGLTVLPTKQVRWAQVLRTMDAEYEQFEKRRLERPMDEWTAQLYKALAVDWT